MNEINTGGPAFPIVGQWGVSEQGMTLRDYFAAHSPITLTDAVEFLDTYGGEVTGPWPPKEVLRTLADLRIEYANAMLKARDE